MRLCNRAARNLEIHKEKLYSFSQMAHRITNIRIYNDKNN